MAASLEIEEPEAGPDAGLNALLTAAVARAEAALGDVCAAAPSLSGAQIDIADITRLSAVLQSAAEPCAVAVRQRFEGAVEGAVWVALNGAAADRLAARLMDDDSACAEEAPAEAIEEIGNIVLSGCLGAMIEVLGPRLDIEQPTLFRSDAVEIARQIAAPCARSAICARLTASVATDDVSAVLALQFEGDDRRMFQEWIDGDPHRRAA